MTRIAVIVASVWVVVAFSVAGVGTVAGAQAGSDAGQMTSGSSGAVPFAQETNETDTTDNETTTANETESSETNETVANETESNETVGNETATNESDIDPGAQLAGVIGVQQAEFQGEVTHRAFGLQIAAARSNGSKAGLLATNTESLEERLGVLENRTEQLHEQYRNGTISTGQYHARLAHLTAQIRMTERLVNQTAETAKGLPPQVLQAHGVNETKLNHLHSRARNMTGPEVAQIAKQVGGKQVGHPLGKERGPPAERPGHGPGDEQPGQGPADDKPGQGPPDDSPGQGGPGDSEHGGQMGQGTGSGGPANNSSAQNASNPGGASENGNANPNAQNAIDAPFGDLLTAIRGILSAAW